MVLPITVKPSKPRLCHDERFLNLWIRDLPFKLDHLSGLLRYVLLGHFQTTLMIKVGISMSVSIHRQKLTSDLNGKIIYMFFVFCTQPFGWKASTFIYHNLVLVVSHASQGINAFMQSIPLGYNINVSPPFVLVGPLLRYFMDQGFRRAFTLVVPDLCPRHFWWALLPAVAVDRLLLGRRGDETVLLFPSRSVLAWSLHNLWWDLWAYAVFSKLSPFFPSFTALETGLSLWFMFISK